MPAEDALGKNPRRDRVLVISRRDCDIRCIDIPPAAAAESDALVRYRLRALYPGNLDHAAVDHVLQKRGRRLVALVVIVPRDTLEDYRARAKGAKLATVAQMVVRSPTRRPSETVVHVAKQHIEILLVEDGMVVESQLVRRTGRRSDLARLSRIFEGGDEKRPVQVLSDTDEEAVVEEAVKLIASSETANPVTVAQMQPRLRRVQPLFRSNGHRTRVSRTTIRISLAALLIAGCVGLFYKYVDLRSAELAIYRRAVTGNQALNARSIALADQEAKLQKELSTLTKAQPTDMYGFFSDLRSVLGGSVTVGDIVARNGLFQLQGSGSSPLTIMERFSASPHFQDVRLLQTTPIPHSDREQFTISGHYQ